MRAVGVDGAANAPEGDPSGADGEVLLDIEVAGGLAPATDIAVYFAPNTDAGFLDAVSEAAHADPTPTAISISWGQSEDQWTAQARTAMDEAFADAARARGDGHRGGRRRRQRRQRDRPARARRLPGGQPGRARLRRHHAVGRPDHARPSGAAAGRGATGGGVSGTFPLPAYQSAAGVPGQADTGRAGRGVPDVAADADPATGYRIRVGRHRTIVLGGTSAVAPLWAALVCRLAQALGGPLGAAARRRCTPGRGRASPRPASATSPAGTNGAYRAGPGWDACTGLGTPDGTALLAALRSG